MCVLAYVEIFNKMVDFVFLGVHNVEFVLSGILKQQLDFYRYCIGI